MAKAAVGARSPDLSSQTWVSATVILVFTALISKALGTFREILVASYFGTSAQVDAFMVALTLVGLVGGIGFSLSAPLVPAYRRALAGDGPARASRLAGGAVGLTLALSASVMLLLVVAPRLLVELVAPALPEATARLAVELTRWLTGLVLGLNMIYILSAIYNALEHFKIPAFMDLASHVCVLLALVLLSATLGIRALALGLGLGALLVGVAMALPIFTRGIVSFNLDFRSAGVRELSVQAAPVFLWELLSQAGGVIENFFGASLEVGSISAVGYAKRLSVVVVSLLAVNVARAAFPVLSKFVAEGKVVEAKDIFLKLGRQSVVAFVPFSIALMYFSQEIVAVAFMRGAFDADAVKKTSGVLLCYAAGVVLLAAIPICTRVCYALSDTVTPLVAGAAGLVAMAGLNYVLTPRLGVKGIALSTSLALVPSVVIMGRTLTRRLNGLDLGELSRVLGLATACGAAALLPVAVLQSSLSTRWEGFPALGIGLALYFAGYIGLSWFAMQREIRALWLVLRRGCR